MIQVYSDGAYSSSRNSGGWSFVVVENDNKIHSSFDKVNNTTNNRMEVLSAIEAIQWCKDNNHKSIILHTDSMYLIGTMTMNWKRKKNHDLWKIIDEVIKNMDIEWKHVKGHNGDKWNEFCDLLCRNASQME